MKKFVFKESLVEDEQALELFRQMDFEDIVNRAFSSLEKDNFIKLKKYIIIDIQDGLYSWRYEGENPYVALIFGIVIEEIFYTWIMSGPAFKLHHKSFEAEERYYAHLEQWFIDYMTEDKVAEDLIESLTKDYLLSASKAA